MRSRGTAKAPDLVQRQFTAEAPDRLWVADITYVPTGAGFLYLAVVVDVFSRRVVGWAMESHLRTELVLQALNMALYLRRPQGVIHHSDQGIQYTAYAFGKRCSEWGVRPSMGSVGDCYDNALCESFFASLECELLDRRSFQTHAEARMAVFQYIEGWYNTHRRHSSIGYYAPIAFERRYTSSIQHVEPLTVHQIGATPTSVLNVLQGESGGIRVSGNVPGYASNRQDAVVIKGPARRNCVAALWNGVEIFPDPYSRANEGEIRLYVVGLFDFAITREDGYKRYRFRNA